MTSSVPTCRGKCHRRGDSPQIARSMIEDCSILVKSSIEQFLKTPGRALLEVPAHPDLKFALGVFGQVDDPRPREPTDGDVSQLVGDLEHGAELRQRCVAPF